MPNPLRGEAELKAGDKTFKIVLDVNAFCELEGSTGLDIEGIVQAVQTKPSITLLRDVFHAGLQRHYPGTTKIDAGEIMSDAGPEGMTDALIVVLQQALPPEKAGSENPPKAVKKRVGTG